MDVFWKHRKRYGTRRIVEELADRGITLGRRTGGEYHEITGLRAIQPKSFKPQTTVSRHRLGYSPNLLLEEFSLDGINQLWVGDITYIPLSEKKVCLLGNAHGSIFASFDWLAHRFDHDRRIGHSRIEDAISIRQPV